MEVSHEAASVVRSWLTASPVVRRRGKNSQLISPRPDRLGLGAESVLEQKKTSQEKAVDFRIQRKVVGKRQPRLRDWDESPIPSKHKKTVSSQDGHNSAILDSASDNECSRSTAISSSKSKKPAFSVDELTNRKKRRRKRNKKSGDGTSGTLPQDTPNTQPVEQRTLDQPVKPDHPVSHDKLVKPDKPVKQDKLIKPDHPGSHDQHVSHDKLVKPGKPVKPDHYLVTPDKLVKHVESVKPDKLNKKHKPDQLDKPDKQDSILTPNAPPHHAAGSTSSCGTQDISGGKNLTIDMDLIWGVAEDIATSCLPDSVTSQMDFGYLTPYELIQAKIKRAKQQRKNDTLSESRKTHTPTKSGQKLKTLTQNDARASSDLLSDDDFYLGESDTQSRLCASDRRHRKRRKWVRSVSQRRLTDKLFGRRWTLRLRKH